MVGQYLAYEQAAMTFPRLALAAEQCDPMLPAAAQKTLHGYTERRLLGHAVIASVTLLVVVLLVCRPPAQRLTKKEVAPTGRA